MSPLPPAPAMLRPIVSPSLGVMYPPIQGSFRPDPPEIRKSVRKPPAADAAGKALAFRAEVSRLTELAAKNPTLAAKRWVVKTPRLSGWFPDHMARLAEASSDERVSRRLWAGENQITDLQEEANPQPCPHRLATYPARIPFSASAIAPA